jgi:hypothetical protein
VQDGHNRDLTMLNLLERTVPGPGMMHASRCSGVCDGRQVGARTEMATVAMQDDGPSARRWIPEERLDAGNHLRIQGVALASTG